MLGFALFGAKEIVVYVVVLIIIIGAIVWFVARGRSGA